MKHSLYICLLAGVVMPGAGSAVLAQEAVSGPDGERPIPNIEVREILPDRVEQAPGATGLLTEAQLEQLRPYTLHDAFDFIPGVRALDDDALGRRTGIGIRGAPSRRSRKVLLLEDGTPINASTYLDPSGHYTPPMERLERIDVLKANGQILHGPLNNHGIINFRNKRPTEQPETSAELSFGNHGFSKQHLMHRRTDGALGTVLSYTRLEADGTFDVEDTEFQDFYAALSWQIDERQSLSASALYYRERSHYDESNLTPAEFAVAPRTKLGRFGQEYNTIAVNYQKYDLTHNFDVTGDWSISSKVFFTDLDRPRFTVDPGEYDVASLPDLVLMDGDGTFVPGPDGNGRMLSRDRHYRTYGAETRLEYAGLSGERVDHVLQWGVRAEHHELLDRRSEGDIGEILTESNRGVVTRDEPYEAQAYSVFLQDVLRFGDWTVIPGLRAETYKQQKQRVFPTVEPLEEYDDSILLPGISVLYSGLGDLGLFASVQRGYTPALARGSDFPLIPEIGLNTQFGARGRLGEGIAFEVAAFYNRLSNTLVQLPFIDPATGSDIFINAVDSRAMGVDLGLRVDSDAYTNSALNLFGMLAYNYTNATFTEGLSDGNRVPEIPRQSGSLTLGLEHAEGWQVSASVSHQASFFTDPANTREPLLANEDGEPLGPGDLLDMREPIVLGLVPSRTTVSARAGYDFSGMTSIWIQGRNLTDKEYISDYSNGLRPGAERTVMAGVSLQFQ
ncbi:MAG TPA: TonB-dependent receptor [Woeseiaceae bacterium]|nr:TonB-dependent receptor [Woeseiaceae bacterium]